jgi:four helix bundle protein
LAVGGRRSAVGGRRSAVGGWRLAVGGRRLAVENNFKKGGTNWLFFGLTRNENDMGKFEELFVFQLSYELAKKIHLITKQFPKDEIYGLTNQIRRSSRSVCVNIVESYRKRTYPKHFLAKLSDADGECSETLIWLRMAKDFEYLDDASYQSLNQEYERVGRLIGSMMKYPEKFAPKS